MKRKVIIMIFITITIVLCGLYLHYENTKLQVSNYKIVNNNISVRELETITRGGDVKKKVPVVRKNKSDNYKYLERQVSEYFGTNVKIGNKKLIISFENDYDLNRILDIMGIKINE